MEKSRIILIGVIFSFLLTTVAVCGQQTDDAEKYLREGAEFENHSYFDRALESYEKALKVDQGNSEAIAGINRVIKKQADFYLEFGKLYEEKGEREKAIEYYKKAVETNPNNTEARKALGSAISKPSKRFQQFTGFFAKLWSGFVKLLLVVFKIAIFILVLVIVIKGGLPYFRKWLDERKREKITIEPFENFPVEKSVDHGKMLSQLVTEKLHKTDLGVYTPKITERKPLLPTEAPKELRIISELIELFFPPNITKVTGRYQESQSKENRTKKIGTTVQLINVKTKKIESVETLWEDDFSENKEAVSKKLKNEKARGLEPLAEAIAYWILFCESEYKPSEYKPKDFKSFFYVQKGDLLFSKGKLDDALDYYTEAINLEKDYAVAYHNKGFIYEIKGDYTNAIEYYNRAIDAIDVGYKKLYLTYFNLGNVYRYRSYEGGKEKDAYLEKSRKYFERSIECIPNDDPKKGIKESRANAAKACTYLLMNGKREEAKDIIKNEESLIHVIVSKKIIKGPSIRYLLANYYSLASGLPTTDTPKKAKYVDKSIKYLKNAISRKKYLRMMAKGDPDFKDIKQKKEFEKLMQG